MGRILIFVLLTALVLPFQNCGQDQGFESARTDSYSGSSTGSSGNTGTIDVVLAPSSLTAAPISSSQINIAWSDNSNNETGFRIDRAPSASGPFSSGSGPGTFAYLANVGANITSYIDTGLTASTIYYYRVSAASSTYYTYPTANASATTQAPAVAAPAAPSNLTATAVSATVVNLNWMDNSANETGFKLERSSNAGATFTLVAAVSADIKTYQDTNLTGGTTYLYRVRASNAVGDSANSLNATVTTPAAVNTSSYTYINTNIIIPNCVGCHGAGAKAAGYDFSTYQGLFNGRNAALADIQNGSMPPGAPLSATQTMYFQNWINAGAPNN